jgi:hypothetical protein
MQCLAVGERSSYKRAYGMRNRAGPVVLLIALALAPPLYVLSMGPAAGLCNRDYITKTTFDRVYAPLRWLDTQSDWWREATDWYCQLWHSG